MISNKKANSISVVESDFLERIAISKINNGKTLIFKKDTQHTIAIVSLIWVFLPVLFLFSVTKVNT